MSYQKKLKLFSIIITFLLFLCPFASFALPAPQGPLVEVITLDGVINPVTAEYLDQSLKKAADDHAEVLVIQLDTPGGLDSSMRQMVKAITGSRVPVITYVSPTGARAASAGVFITLASQVAAMAPGTNIGAAHPVGMGGGKLDKTMAAKVENDAAAYIASLAAKYGRNAAWAEQAVRKSVSITEAEAVRMHVVDLAADNLDDLLAKVDGRKVQTASGEEILHTRGARVVREETGARYKFLKALSDPNIAYILMMIGILGIFFELSNPGLIFPGVVGGISLILAFYSLQTLPVNYAGLMLILLAIVFFIAEVKIVSHGLLALAGACSLTFGSIMLIDAQAPYMRVSLELIIPAVATLSAFFIILIRVAVKARRTRVTMGKEGLIGEAGEARTDIDPEGDVFVQGAHWRAYSDEPVRKGERVVVERVEGLKLKVTKK